MHLWQLDVANMGVFLWGFFCPRNKSARDLISRTLKVVFHVLSAESVLILSFSGHTIYLIPQLNPLSRR